MTTVSDSNKAIAKYITQIVGIRPSARKYWDESETTDIDLFTCVDPVDQSCNVYGTIGLSDTPLVISGKEQSFRLELLAAGHSSYSFVPNLLATSSFYIMKDAWECTPGVVFESVVSMYHKGDMKHLMFTSPFLWADKLKNLELPDKKVTWLLIVPISDKELIYKSEYGYDALENLFDEKNINIFDLDRKSVI